MPGSQVLVNNKMGLTDVSMMRYIRCHKRSTTCITEVGCYWILVIPLSSYYVPLTKSKKMIGLRPSFCPTMPTFLTQRSYLSVGLHILVELIVKGSDSLVLEKSSFPPFDPIHRFLCASSLPRIACLACRPKKWQI